MLSHHDFKLWMVCKRVWGFHCRLASAALPAERAMMQHDCGTWYLLVELKGISATLGFLALMSRTFPQHSSMHFNRADSDASPAVSLWGKTHSGTLAQSLTYAYWEMSVVCLAAWVYHTVVEVSLKLIKAAPERTFSASIMVLIVHAGNQVSSASPTHMMLLKLCNNFNVKVMRVQNLAFFVSLRGEK